MYRINDIYKGYLLECVMVHGLNNPAVAVSQQKVQGPDSSSICNSNLVLESQGIPLEMLVFSLHWNHKKQVPTLAKECLSNKINEFASESDDKQAKSKSFLFHFLLCELPPEDIVQIWWSYQLEFQLISEIVKLTDEISYHK